MSPPVCAFLINLDSLRQAQSLLAVGTGTVHVALRSTPFYDSWDITQVAKDAGLELETTLPFEGARFAALGVALLTNWVASIAHKLKTW